MIVPVEDMPYLKTEPGLTSCLKPARLAFRMNVGQSLGRIWAGPRRAWDASKDSASENVDHMPGGRHPPRYATLLSETLREKAHPVRKIQAHERQAKYENGEQTEHGRCAFATPVFDRRKKRTSSTACQGRLDSSGQVDAQSTGAGRAVDRKVTSATSTMLKLLTGGRQDPRAFHRTRTRFWESAALGGKVVAVGGPFGERECWALQAYGAAYSLQGNALPSKSTTWRAEARSIRGSIV